jgi:hypothetical protein
MNWQNHISSEPYAVPTPIRAGLLVTFAAMAAFGQVSVVRSGSLEVGPYAGASYGVDKLRVMAGGNITYALNKYVLPYFEYSYFPGLPRTGSTIANGLQAFYSYSVPLSDVHGGLHVRLPVFRESPFVPYLVAGAGILYYPGEHELITYQVFSEPVSVKLRVPAATSTAINFGGGLRYYIGGTGRFGLRAEAKLYKPLSGVFSNTEIGKVEIGVFFQLR